MKKDIYRLGVHTSIAGGVHLSLERAKALGCNTMQIFSHNPRQWFVNNLSADSVGTFKGLSRAYDIRPVFIHVSYLINLCASAPAVLEKSIGLLIKELDMADVLDVEYVVLHTGSASAEEAGPAKAKAVKALKRISSEKEWKTRLLLENTAGERGDISSSVGDLKEIMNGAGTSLIGGVCIDTCHAFAAGYDISSKGGVDSFVEELRKLQMLEHIKLIHLNDSKKGRNSRVDRHEHIGEGQIGRAGIKYFINHSAFKNVPMILETPKKDEEDDPRNLKLVRELISR
ncbi:MAG: deoxyribonuclease IV [Nitrospirae bacterium]|nr:MAG: deoxyribonuclease IV [Nitrospirota bacterium]